MASQQELACIYAALALQDGGVEITGDKIQALVSAAGVTVEPFWPGLYAKALKGVDVQALVTSLGSSVGSAGAAPAAAAATTAAPVASAPAAESKKKEEPKEESDDDMGFGLFD